MPKPKILASLGFWDVTATGVFYREDGSHYDYEIPGEMLWDGELSGGSAANSWEAHIARKRFAPIGSKNYNDFLKIIAKAREIHADKMPPQARQLHQKRGETNAPLF